MSDSTSEFELLTLLTQVSQQFFTESSVPLLLEKLLHSSIKMTHGDRGSLFLIPERDRNSPRAMSTLIATGLQGQTIDLDISRGIVGFVFRSGQSVLIHNVQKDPRFYPDIDLKTGYVTQTLIAAPLLGPHGQCLGAIEILNSSNGKFTETDLKILEVLANFATIALLQSRHTDRHEKIIRNHCDITAIINRFLSEAFDISTDPRIQEMLHKIPSVAQTRGPIAIFAEAGLGTRELAWRIHVQRAPKSVENGFFFDFTAHSHPSQSLTAALENALSEIHFHSAAGTLYFHSLDQFSEARLREVRDFFQRHLSGIEPSHFRLIASFAAKANLTAPTHSLLAECARLLNHIRIEIPPLRERPHDAYPLVQLGVRILNETYAVPLQGLDAEWKDFLQSTPWEKNHEELWHVLSLAFLYHPEGLELRLKDLYRRHERWYYIPSLDLRGAKDRLEDLMIERALVKTSGRKGEAAEHLGLTREGLRKALKKFQP